MAFSFMLFLSSWIVFFVIKLDEGRIALNPAYVSLYGWLGIGLGVLSGIAFFFDFVFLQSEDDREDNSFFSKAFFIWDHSWLRPGSQLIAIPLFFMVVMAVASYALVSTNDGAFFTPINPYSTAAFSADTLAQHSVVDNVFLGAVVQGIYEEGAIFFLIQMTAFMGLLLVCLAARDIELLEKWWVYWPVTLVCILIWSAVFAYSHGRYAGDQSASNFAFVFEFILQLMNQLTGSFISFLPHFTHNLAVIQYKAFSFIAFAGS